MKKKSWTAGDGARVSGITNHLAERVGRGDTAKRQVDSFTPKQIELFEHRLEEGYDLFHDTDYVHWLKLCHPEVVTK